MIKQLLNSAIAKYRDLSVARRSIICLCLRHRQIIDLLATDKSRYFAQPRPIIVYYYLTSPNTAYVTWEWTRLFNHLVTVYDNIPTLVTVVLFLLRVRDVT